MRKNTEIPKPSFLNATRPPTQPLPTPEPFISDGASLAIRLLCKPTEQLAQAPPCALWLSLVPPVKSHSIGSDEAAPGILGGGQSAASLRRRALWTPGTASAGPPMSLVRQKEPDPHLKGRSRHLRDHLREPSREGRTSVLALPPKLPTFHPVPEQARATAGCSQGTAKSAQTG